MSLKYNASNWYWIVSGSTTDVFSAASGSFVAPINPAYVAWLADGGLPARIDSNASLVDVLQSQAPAVSLWALYSLAQARDAQVAIINAACQPLIVAGQLSSALGAPHIYPTNITDQQNLSANVLSSLLPGVPAGWTTPQMCMSSTGVWAMVPHTATQIQQVGQDVADAIKALLVKSAGYQTDIMAVSITTVSEVQAVTWS